MHRFSPSQMNAIMDAFPGAASCGVAMTEEALFGDEHAVDGFVEGSRDDGSPDDTAALEAFLADQASADDTSVLQDFLADEAAPSEAPPAVAASPADVSPVDPPPVEAPPPGDTPRRSRAEQSRLNGAKSRGPTSAAGKAASAQNAYKHGLRSRGQLGPGEDPVEFENFVAEFRDDLHADGPCQVMLAERAAEMAWKLNRMPTVRSAVLFTRRDPRCDDDAGYGGLGELGDIIYELRKGDNKGGVVMLLQRYETQIERSMQASLRELRILQGGTRNGRSPQGENHATAGSSPPRNEATSRVRSAVQPSIQSHDQTLQESVVSDAGRAGQSVTRASSPCEVRDTLMNCSELDSDIARTGWKPVSRTEPSPGEANRVDARVRSAEPPATADAQADRVRAVLQNVVAAKVSGPLAWHGLDAGVTASIARKLMGTRGLTQDLCTPDAKLGFVRQSA